MYIARSNEPALPEFPQSINELLNRCVPISPMRAASFDISTIGEPILPHPLIQIAPSAAHDFKDDLLATLVTEDGKARRHWP